VLAEDGLLLLNLVDAAPFAWSRRVVAGVRSQLPALMVSAEPATLRGRRPGNLLLVAARRIVPVGALRTRASSSVSPYRILAGSLLSDTLGGGVPFSDDDAQPSPGRT
jgi:hypothetical protein